MRNRFLSSVVCGLALFFFSLPLQATPLNQASSLWSHIAETLSRVWVMAVDFSKDPLADPDEGLPVPPAQQNAGGQAGPDGPDPELPPNIEPSGGN